MSDIDNATEHIPAADGYESQLGEATIAPSLPNAKGKLRAVTVSTAQDSSSDESESVVYNDDSVYGLTPALPQFASGSDMDIPSLSSRLSPPSAMGSVIAFEAVPTENTAASDLVFESVAGPTPLNEVQPTKDANEPLSTRRAKRARAYVPVSEVALCAEEDCVDNADVQPMIACAGPGCGLVVSLLPIL